MKIRCPLYHILLFEGFNLLEREREQGQGEGQREGEKQTLR